MAEAACCVGMAWQRLWELPHFVSLMEESLFLPGSYSCMSTELFPKSFHQSPPELAFTRLLSQIWPPGGKHAALRSITLQFLTNPPEQEEGWCLT